MDWKNLKDKALKFKDKAVEYSWVAYEKSKEYTNIAIDKTWQALAQTPLAMKIVADFEKIKDDKLVVLLFINKDEKESKKILLTMPVILSKVWINSATFRTCEITDSKEVAEHFEVTQVPTLIIYEKWEQKKKTSDLNEINKYLKEFVL